MQDAASGWGASPERHQRATGTLRLVVKRRQAATVLERLRQEGCLKARFPHNGPDAWMEAVTLNSSGGIAGGDRLDSTIAVGAGAALTVASQAAERIYRALPGSAPATITTRITVAAGARAEWLPQETILFDGCALDRTLTVELAEDAAFAGVETLVFGRAAMGETVRHARIHDRLVIRRAGRLLLHDAVRLHGEVAARLAHPAVAGGARAVATLIHVAPSIAADALAKLRAALGGVEAGASQWDDMLVARILAPDQASLRLAVIAGLQSLRTCRNMPRVWSC